MPLDPNHEHIDLIMGLVTDDYDDARARGDMLRAHYLMENARRDGFLIDYVPGGKTTWSHTSGKTAGDPHDWDSNFQGDEEFVTKQFRIFRVKTHRKMKRIMDLKEGSRVRVNFEQVKVGNPLPSMLLSNEDVRWYAQAVQDRTNIILRVYIPTFTIALVWWLAFGSWFTYVVMGTSALWIFMTTKGWGMSKPPNVRLPGDTEYVYFVTEND